VHRQLGVRAGDHDLARQEARARRAAGAGGDRGAHVADLAGDDEEALASEPVGDPQVDQVDRSGLERDVGGEDRRRYGRRLDHSERVELALDAPALAAQHRHDLLVHLWDHQLVDQVRPGDLDAAARARADVLDRAGEQQHVLARVDRSREQHLHRRLLEHRVGGLDAARDRAQLDQPDAGLQGDVVA
jgi:hypothetical protein